MPDAAWFATLVTTPEERWCARLLLASLRAFAGPLANSPVLLFATDLPEPPGRGTVAAFADQGVQIVRLVPDSMLGDYLFAGKVAAATIVDIPAIEGALKAGGNTHYTIKVLPGLNHLFQTCTTGAVAEYSLIEETFSPKALKETADWILETVSSLNSRQ